MKFLVFRLFTLVTPMTPDEARAKVCAVCCNRVDNLKEGHLGVQQKQPVCPF